MNFNPRLAWQSAYFLDDGDSAHIKNVTNYSLRKPDGELTKKGDEAAKIWEPHFEKVYNNEREVNWSVLDDINQREKVHNLDDDITRPEFDNALDGLVNLKAPGENGVPPDIIKSLKGEN